MRAMRGAQRWLGHSLHVHDGRSINMHQRDTMTNVHMWARDGVKGTYCSTIELETKLHKQIHICKGMK
jgi:hypothetical protein